MARAHALSRIRARYGAPRRGPPRKMDLPFDELYELFKADCVTFAAIAREHGVSRERVRQIYNKWFRDHVGDKSGHDRIKECTLERIEVRKRQVVRQSDRLRLVVERAEARGLQVTGVVGNHVTKPICKCSLEINGRRCLVKHTSSRTQHARYWKFNITLESVKSCDFVILCAEDRHFFIIPAKLFVGVKHIYFVPIERRPSKHGPRRRLDAWLYHEAWHQLGRRRE